MKCRLKSLLDYIHLPKSYLLRVLITSSSVSPVIVNLKCAAPDPRERVSPAKRAQHTRMISVRQHRQQHPTLKSTLPKTRSQPPGVKLDTSTDGSPVPLRYEYSYTTCRGVVVASSRRAAATACQNITTGFGLDFGATNLLKKELNLL